MDCSKCRDSMHDYAKGCLDVKTYNAVNKHLGTCEDCRNELNEIQGLRALGTAKSISPTLQLDLKNSIMASIDLDRYKPPRKKNTNETIRWGISMVAAGLVMLVLSSVPLPFDNIEKAAEQKKIIQTVDSFGKGFSTMSERLLQLNGITDRLEKHHKGGV